MFKRTFHFMAYPGPARASRWCSRSTRWPARSRDGPGAQGTAAGAIHLPAPQLQDPQGRPTSGRSSRTASWSISPKTTRSPGSTPPCWSGPGRSSSPRTSSGVDGFTDSIMRSGGSATMTGEQINERMDFLAGTVTATQPVHPHPLSRRRPEDLDGHPDEPGLPRG